MTVYGTVHPLRRALERAATVTGWVALWVLLALTAAGVSFVAALYLWPV